MGVNYLLDTHAFVWLCHPDTSRGRGVRAELDRSAATVSVSAVSAFELSTKTRLGTIDARALVEDWERSVLSMGAQPLDLSAAHARLAGGLSWEHRDPFDRLLVAQAMSEAMTLVTADTAILSTAPDDLSTLRWH